MQTRPRVPGSGYDRGQSGPPNPAFNPAGTAVSPAPPYAASNAVDGNTSTYWEGTNGAWPTTFTVNLGASKALGSIVLDLPPSAAWNTRTQTLSVLGSADGSSYSTLVGSATYTFNPSTGNTVTIPLRPAPATSTSALRSPPTASRTAPRPPKWPFTLPDQVSERAAGDPGPPFHIGPVRAA